MSFNALVSAIGSHLGLSPLMNDAGYGPPPPDAMPPGAAPFGGGFGGGAAEGAPAPAAAKAPAAGKSNTAIGPDFRLGMRAQDRQMQESAEARGSRPGGGGNVALPGVMSPEVLKHPMVQALLNHFGVNPEVANSAAESASPNLFMTNPAFNANHPHVAGALEGALGSLAAFKPGNDFGENLSAIAQAQLGARQMRTEKYNAQLMMPFNQAATVAGLKQPEEQQRFQEAQVLRDEALSKHYADMDNVREYLAQIADRNEQDRAHNQGQIDELKMHQQNDDLLKVTEKVPLNPSETDAINGLVKQYGDFYHIPTEKLAPIYSGAAQRAADAERANKRAVAAIGGSSRQATAGNLGKSEDFNVANEAFKKAQDTLAHFRNSTNIGIDPVSGKTLMGTTYTARLAELQQDVEKAQDAVQKVADRNKLALPGTGVGGPRPKGSTYNMRTGQFE